MGLSKLNVWLRDEKCKPHVVSKCGYVNVCHFDDLFIGFESKPVPVGAANVELEVPPGCYLVSGCSQLGDSMDDCFLTDKVMVIVGCNQELCVNLIVPELKTRALRDVLPFIRKARLIGISERDITTTTQTIMKVGGISKEEMVDVIENKQLCAKAAKKSGKESEKISKKVSKDYQETLNIIRKTE
jgi:hypothetical protein